MNRDDYAATQLQLCLLGRMAINLPLAEFIVAIDRAEACGPVLDPTLYLRGAERMEAIKDMAAAALSLQQRAARCFELLEPAAGEEVGSR